MMSRRKFIEWCGRLCLLLGIGFPSDSSAAAAASKEDPHTPVPCGKLSGISFPRQIVAQDSSTSRAILWQTEKQMDGARLEYRRTGDETALWGDVSYDYLSEAGTGTFVYACLLDGLRPDTDYEFRIFHKNRATSWSQLRRVNEQHVQMLVFCDSQCADYSVWRSVAETACRRHPDAELVTVIGDLVDNGASPDQWRRWNSAADALLAPRIFAPVMGNHECYSLEWQMCLPEGYLHRFLQPDNGSSDFPGYYYSFDYGPARFFVLNTQMEELDGLRPGLLQEELAWLRREAATTEQPWRVVLMHKDIIEYERPSPTKGETYISDIGEAFMPVFEECRIDLVLTGHFHTYRNRHHVLGGTPSPHGPVYVICGLAGDQRYPDLPIHPTLDLVVAPQPETDNYLTLDIDEKRLRLQCYLMDGTIIDDMTLTR